MASRMRSEYVVGLAAKIEEAARNAAWGTLQAEGREKATGSEVARRGPAALRAAHARMTREILREALALIESPEEAE